MARGPVALVSAIPATPAVKQGANSGGRGAAGKRHCRLEARAIRNSRTVLGIYTPYTLVDYALTVHFLPPSSSPRASKVRLNRGRADCTADMRFLSKLSGHTDSVLCCEFSPSTALLATGSEVGLKKEVKNFAYPRPLHVADREQHGLTSWHCRGSLV